MERVGIDPELSLLLASVRSALWQKPLQEDALSQVRTLNAAQWDNLVVASQKQTVTGLLFLALDRLPSEIKVPEGISLALMVAVDRIVRMNARIHAAEAQLLDLCAASGLHPVQMKGSTAAARYPVPDYRESGDIDLYLPHGEMELARELFDSAGYAVSGAPDGSMRFCVQEIEVDLHDHYYDLYVDLRRLPPIPSPEAELLMLAAHALKHAAGTGVGLRQICDFALADRAYKGDPRQLDAYFHIAGLDLGVLLLRDFVTAWLNPGEDSAADREAEAASTPLLKIVAEGGNFGHFSSGRVRRLYGSSLVRKMDTALRMLRRMPFAFRYAPAGSWRRVFELVRGQ